MKKRSQQKESMGRGSESLMGYPPKKITGKTTIEVSGHEIQLILLSFGGTHKRSIYETEEVLG